MDDKVKKEEKNTLPDDSIKTYLILDEGKYKTKLTKKYLQRKTYQPINPKHIISFIPGTIRKVNVKEGSKVKKGQELLQLEAMKMINQILSPMDGAIKKVHVKQGDLISFHQLLIEFS